MFGFGPLVYVCSLGLLFLFLMYLAPLRAFTKHLRQHQHKHLRLVSRCRRTDSRALSHATNDLATIQIAEHLILGSRSSSSGSSSGSSVSCSSSSNSSSSSRGGDGDDDSGKGWLYTDSKVAKRKRSFRVYFPSEQDRSVGYVVVNKKNIITYEDAMVVCEIAKELAVSENTTRTFCLSGHDNVHMRAIMALRSCNIGLYTPRSLRSNLRTSLRKDDDHANDDAISKPTFLDLSHLRTRSSRRIKFQLHSPFLPSKEQEIAVNTICENFKNNRMYQTLMGATGTGKTFMAASIISKVQKPTLILVPNKVLAAQLYNELKEFLPNNAIEYFVSFYDYYLPESYKSASDTYIEKVTQINEDIDRMRHSATRSLIERDDCVVVSSISCIYGLGMPVYYAKEAIRLEIGGEMRLEDLQAKLLSLSYKDVDSDLFSDTSAELSSPSSSPDDLVSRGAFKVWSKGGDSIESIEIGPASDEFVVNIEFSVEPSTGASIISKIVRTDREIDSSKISILQRLKSAGVDPATSEVMDESRLENENIVQRISDSSSGSTVGVEYITIYPASHHVVDSNDREEVWKRIEYELEERYSALISTGHTLEAERLRQRTETDLMMLRAIGTCKGIENYSRHIAGRAANAPSDCLLDYFRDDWLLVVDESHITIPQIKAMFYGDHSRKVNLVKHGFRLPSAIDNRPLKAEEFWNSVDQVLFTSATPGKFEATCNQQSVLNIKEYIASDPISYPSQKAMQIFPNATDVNNTVGNNSNVSYWDDRDDDVLDLSNFTEQIASYSNEDTSFGDNPWWDAEVIIRPTGIVDPVVEVRPSCNQVENLLYEINKRTVLGERILVTCLTKRMSEDLSLFLQNKGYRSTYLHSGVKPMQRLEIIRSLRRGEIDVLVGVNLLREGLNLPEVTLVAIMDADKEGFLRSDTALIQTIGRASRNVGGHAILYADRMTGSMSRAIKETERRRRIQTEHNNIHNITPKNAYSTTAEDTILEIVESNAMADKNKMKTNAFDMNAITKRLQGGNSAYSNSPHADAVLAFSYDEDKITYEELSGLRDKANEMMLDASDKMEFKLAAVFRDVRNDIKASMEGYEQELMMAEHKNVTVETFASV